MVQWLLRACFGMTGQRCLGVDNVVIVGDIYDEVKRRFVEAAKNMKLTAEDALRLKVIDGIVPEPVGGAHRDHKAMALQIRVTVLHELGHHHGLTETDLEQLGYG